MARKPILGDENMKKILLGALTLMVMSLGPMALAQTTNGIVKPQMLQDYEKDHAMGRHTKKTRGGRKIAGTANRGAKQVSPSPKKENYPFKN